jgi:hypothetical protein
MADNQKKEAKEEIVIKEQPKKDIKTNKGSDKTLIWVFSILAVFIFVCVFIGGFGLMAYERDNHKNTRVVGFDMMAGGGRGFGHRGMMDDGIVSTNQSVISGVVTSVSDQSFVIAGNGTTNTIQINSDTKYSGASKVSVNDSVTVAGTTSNGSFTATQVVVRNQ